MKTPIVTLKQTKSTLFVNTLKTLFAWYPVSVTWSTSDGFSDYEVTNDAGDLNRGDKATAFIVRKGLGFTVWGYSFGLYVQKRNPNLPHTMYKRAGMRQTGTGNSL